MSFKITPLAIWIAILTVLSVAILIREMPEGEEQALDSSNVHVSHHEENSEG